MAHHRGGGKNGDEHEPDRSHGKDQRNPNGQANRTQRGGAVGGEVRWDWLCDGGVVHVGVRVERNVRQIIVMAGISISR